MNLDPDQPGAQDLLTVDQRVVYLEEYHRVEGDPVVKHSCAWYKAVVSLGEKHGKDKW